MITVLIWERHALIYNYSLSKRSISIFKLTSHMSDRYRLMDDNCPDKKSCIDLFIERLEIVLSDFCPDICP
jgi:hypothetical protein